MNVDRFGHQAAEIYLGAWLAQANMPGDRHRKWRPNVEDMERFRANPPPNWMRHETKHEQAKSEVYGSLYGFFLPPPHCDHSSTITLIIICTTLTIALHFNKRWHALFLLEKQQLLIHYQKYEMLLRGWTNLKHFYNCWPLWGTYEISSNCCSTCRAMMFRWAAYAQLLKQYGREWWIS